MKLTLSLLLLCCSFSFVTKGQAPVANFTASSTSGCAPLAVIFTDQSTGSPKSWNWNIGGILKTGQGPQYAVFSTPGTYSVTLTVTNANGINSITKTNYIVVNPSPTVAISSDKTTTCLPATIHFLDNSVANAGNLVSWAWDFGDKLPSGGSTSTSQNPTHTYTTPGYYDVYLRVTSSSGCSSDKNNPRYIRIVDRAKADFSVTGPATCIPPFNVLYNNLTSGPGNLTYNWDLGNSTTSTQTSPNATYTTGGNYPVQLIASSDYGCSDTIKKTIPVTGSNTSFSVNGGTKDTVCFGTAITFQNTSSPAPTKVSWDFGDGTQYNGPTPPPKTYASTGVYPVKMTATFTSCTNTATQNIVVQALPTVDFSSANSNKFCKPPAAIVFQNISPDYVTVNWNFGDGTTSNSATNPITHTYNTTGSLPVTLTITDSHGCTNTITKPNFVNILAPYVTISGLPAGVCVGQVFTPSPNIGTVDGVAFYQWDYGDGTGLTSVSSHTYTAPGSYTLTFNVTTNGGCMSSTVVPNAVQVGMHSVVDFSESPTVVCRSSSVQFTNLSAPMGSSWLWDFGDTTISNLQNPSHKFPDTGYYSIKLKVTNQGCTDSLTKNNFVQILPPAAKFGYQIADCATRTNVTFLDSSEVNSSLTPFTYSWTFDTTNAASTSSAIPPATVTFPYPGTGVYTARLIIQDGACRDTAIRTIRVINEKANFTFNKTPAVYCRNEDITISVANTVNRVNIKKAEWIIDGATPFPGPDDLVIKIDAAGTHSAQLILTDLNGCTDTSAVQQFTVTGPKASFTAGSKGGGCSNSTITFNDASVPSSAGPITKWIFDFGDGSAPQTFTSPPFTHTYKNPGTDTVKLTVYDNTGNNCSNADTVVVVITDPVPKFSTDYTTYCPGTPLQFRDSSVGNNLTYFWNFGDGTTDTTQNPLHTYPAFDSVYTVKLVITDSVGCSDSLTLTKYINIKAPKATYTVKDTATLCPPLETTFNFTGTNYQTFDWNFGDGSDPSTLASTDHFYNSFGKYTAKLYAYGNGGCVDSASININVTDPSLVTRYTFTPAQGCYPLTTTFSLTVPYSTLFWFGFGDGYIDSTQQTSLQHIFTLPNTYSPAIYLKDKDTSTGCVVIIGGQGNVVVQGAIPLFGADKHSFCDSGSVYFSNYSQAGADPIVTNTWTFGDGTPPTVLTNDAIHDYTIPGLYVPMLTVTTAAGCSQTYFDTVRVLATPKPLITSVAGVCYNLPINFSGSLLNAPDTGIVWKWNLGNGQTSDSQNIALVYADTGLYHISLTATNDLGCKGDTTEDINVFPLPVIKISGDTTTVSGGTGITIPLTYSANATTFNWSPPTNLSCTDCANPFATPKFTTTYTVTVTDANGCVNTKNITVLVTCNNKNFFIPNTFSPNNDGANDVFYPRGTGLYLIQALRVFNRWGELIFEKRNFAANDPTSGWDGTYKGKPAPVDTYIYMVDIICDNANVITYKGNITLIR